MISSLEECIAANPKTSKNTSFNPVIFTIFTHLEKQSFNINNIKRTSAPIMLYKALLNSKQQGLMVKTNSIAYGSLANHAQKINFRGKEHYIASCYVFPLSIIGNDFFYGIENSNSTIYYLTLNQSELEYCQKRQNNIEELMQINIEFLTKQINLLNEKQEAKTKLFYNFFEKDMSFILSNAIQELQSIRNIYHNEQHPQKSKEFIKESIYFLEECYDKLHNAYINFRKINKGDYIQYMITDDNFKDFQKKHKLYSEQYKLPKKSIDTAIIQPEQLEKNK